MEDVDLQRQKEVIATMAAVHSPHVRAATDCVNGNSVQAKIEESKLTLGQHHQPMPPAVPTLHITAEQPRESEGPGKVYTEYVNQSRVEAMLEESKAQPRGIEGAEKISVQHTDRVNLSQAMTEESISRSSQHHHPMLPAVPTPHAKRSESPDYVNQSRVQAMLDEIEARKRPLSPESLHSADESLTLPPPIVTFPLDEQNVVAEGLGDDHEGGGVRQVTGVPYDPNLKCLMCEKEFRVGEIQLFRSHVATCGTVV